MKPIPTLAMLMDVLKFRSNKNTVPFDKLYSADSREKIDFDVFLPTKGFNLQRPLVWTELQNQQLILSIIKGTPVPTIAVVKHKDTNDTESVFQVIDGKQRLNAYIRFCDGEYSIPIGGYDYTFDELPNELQWKVQNFSFYGDMAFSYGTDASDKDFITDDDKIKWFNQRNFAGTEQEEEHITKLRQALVR